MRRSAVTPGFVVAFVAVVAMTVAPLHVVLAGAPRFQAPGSVTIMSTTVGAIVEIDGKVVGKIPLDDSIVLPAGVHRVRVSLRGWTEFQDTFEVAPGEDLELEIDLLPVAGIVRVNTPQPGATVKVDGKVEGVTPFDRDVPVGPKVITISQQGFFDETREVLVTAGEEHVFDVTMRPLPVEEPPTSSAAFYEQWWFWTIIAVAGAGTATAFALSSGGETAPPSAAFTLQIP